MNISIVIPTYGRPEILRVCVESLFEGSTHPDEVIIVGRCSDIPTVQTIADLEAHPTYGQYIKSEWVRIPGHIPPVQKGMNLATGDIIALIDDDVTVTHDWLKQIITIFTNNPKVGVVGGRVLTDNITVKLRGRPGQMTWYGKYWGNIGFVDGNEPFKVITVMEGNSAWRKELVASLEFDMILNFDDASMYGMDLTFQAQKLGYTILYNPRMAVYHNLAPRNADLDRGCLPRRIFARCRNYTYLMLKHLEWWRKPFFLLYSFLIGGRGNWGIASILIVTMLNGIYPKSEVLNAIAGKIEGIRLWFTKN
jgi:GT2 family glycosyltransferase